MTANYNTSNRCLPTKAAHADPLPHPGAARIGPARHCVQAVVGNIHRRRPDTAAPRQTPPPGSTKAVVPRVTESEGFSRLICAPVRAGRWSTNPPISTTRGSSDIREGARVTHVAAPELDATCRFWKTALLLGMTAMGAERTRTEQAANVRSPPKAATRREVASNREAEGSLPHPAKILGQRY